MHSLDHGQRVLGLHLRMDAVTEVAKDTAKELVAALGGKADAQGVSAAVSARLKG